MVVVGVGVGKAPEIWNDLGKAPEIWNDLDKKRNEVCAVNAFSPKFISGSGGDGALDDIKNGKDDEDDNADAENDDAENENDDDDDDAGSKEEEDIDNNDGGDITLRGIECNEMNEDIGDCERLVSITSSKTIS